MVVMRVGGGLWASLRLDTPDASQQRPGPLYLFPCKRDSTVKTRLC